MCGNTKAEILRAIMGNLKNHDFTVFSKFEIDEEQGLVLLEALQDYKGMCQEGDFFHVPFPAQVFNSEAQVRRGKDGKIMC